MKKFSFQIVGLLILIIGGLMITTNQDVISMITGKRIQAPLTKLQIKNTEINVEIADDEKEQIKGLSGRESLASDSGLLFTYKEPAIRRFWMKGMQFPIDIIWIRNNKVVDLLLGAEPPAENTPDSNLAIFQPNTPVDSVLEVNAGFVNKHGISIGDDVIIDSK